MAMDKSPLLAQPLHCSVFSQQAKLSRINSFGFNGPSPGSNSRGPVVGVDRLKAVVDGLSRFDRFTTKDAVQVGIAHGETGVQVSSPTPHVGRGYSRADFLFVFLQCPNIVPDLILSPARLQRRVGPAY